MQPRWLSAQEQRTWRSFSDLSLVMEDALDQQLRHDSGMSHLNYSVLVILSELPEQRLRMTDLAEKLRIARTRLSYTIARMEEEGWVRREDSPGDKRAQLAVLTEAGVTALAEAAPGHVALVRATVFDRLTPEQTRAFGEACAIILAGMTGPERPALPVDLPWRR
ncbi:MarR family winged helix-turn-helix transcriptional regulator [Streptomyces acidiscabies]|uniref:MarR family transcriptional regulator n=1 Tax=Streptomyces acidiscabies TaxID=42234 RepID=A0AAP6EDJ0_9ACTN|nr:MarR family transcriptional regulator [Streptomyces acidiscabies]MBP5941361.1 MarR family transcriptional regulator [Streptomyces sp. LBUM 1476]MBZ3912721.1 MarR family transcriptional regulator [Streptomyces acidiscabies]MDX2958205.1 MarR family transcriptional regulator [Streptomyces acidiscabies]MDX3018572.1 MarR family transcriptional regulator [Streptomyces acidiscabies]MDX3791125.1 MarR family transcriptional regulator [Streptomyces acidiscabies]